VKRNNFKGFIDTTLRDGQESPVLFDTYKYSFNLEEKKQIVKALINLGVSHIEFFSPVVSQAEKRDFVEIREYIRSITPKKVLLLAHCRCRPEDIEQAIEVGFNGLNLYMGLSVNAQKYSYGKNLQEIEELVKNTIISTRKKYPKIYLRYSAEDAFRTPLKNIFRIYDQVYDYVDTFGMPDTTGTATPMMVRQRVRALKKRYPNVNFECHFHNDRGYALINTITAIESGVEYADTSVWGLAERSGIASVTGVLLNLFYLDKDYVKKYNLKFCYPLNVLMGSILKMQIPFTEPVSLTNRTHIAGVHQKAVLNNKDVYEGHDLGMFGVNKTQLLLGSLTGWHFIYYYLKEVKGFLISQDQAKSIAKEFKKKAGKVNRESSPEKLLLSVVKRHSLPRVIIPKGHKDRRIEDLS